MPMDIFVIFVKWFPWLAIILFFLRPKLRERFKEELFLSLEKYKKNQDQNPNRTLDKLEIIERRLNVNQRVLRIASKYGGVKICCPPLGPEHYDPQDCIWCWQKVTPETDTGQCPYCPLNVKIWDAAKKKSKT